jgi:hypothetical protein
MIVFKNKGLIDMDMLRVFGVSAKEVDQPIGKFGTGLKYAISVLLRHSQQVVLARGTQLYVFGVASREIRGKQVQQVRMRLLTQDEDNWESLPFTLDLGAHWELWMAFRELYSNMLDENGEHEQNTHYEKAEDQTGILVSGEQFVSIYHQRHLYFLENRKLLHVSERCKVYYGASEYVYYRGIRVAKLDKPSRFTYDLQGVVSLTEDRTLAMPYEAIRAIAVHHLNSANRKMLTEVLLAPKGTLEGELDYRDAYFTPGEVFLDVVEEVRGGGNCGLINASADLVYRKMRADKALASEVSTTPTEEQQQMLDTAIFTLELAGYTKIRDTPITIATSLGQGVYGLAVENRAYISQAAFIAGQRQLTATLLEEHLHLTYFFVDESRDFQNYLVCEVARLAEMVVAQRGVTDVKLTQEQVRAVGEYQEQKLREAALQQLELDLSEEALFNKDPKWE